MASLDCRPMTSARCKVTIVRITPAFRHCDRELAAPAHNHDLVLADYAVRTSSDALSEGETQIAAIKGGPVEKGRL
jgi:hypothetical protein